MVEINGIWVNPRHIVKVTKRNKSFSTHLKVGNKIEVIQTSKAEFESIKKIMDSNSES